jgi:PAS domain S-box-containing protein
LVDYGLSNAQAKIYLALLETGLASVSEISKKSNVARPDTYRTLLELHQTGLVEKMIGKPTMYQPLHITDAISVLNSKREKESLDLTRRSKELIKHVGQKENNDTNTECGEFVLIHGDEAIELKLKNLIENVQESICSIIPGTRLQHWVEDNYEIVAKTLERNVHVCVISECSSSQHVLNKFNELKINPLFEIRNMTEKFNFLLRIFDGKIVLIRTQPKNGFDQALAICSNNTSLLEMAQNYFNTVWFYSVNSKDSENKKSPQLGYLFENVTKAFSYNKIIFDTEGNPIDFTVLTSNFAFDAIVGFDKSMQGKKATNVLAHLGSKLQEMIVAFGELVTTRKAIVQEHYFPTVNRTFSVCIYSPEEGYFATIFDDITELKKAQKALQEKEETQHFLTKYVPFGIYEIDCKTLQFLSSNEFMHNTTGYTEAEILSKSPFDLLADESKEVFQEIIRKTWKGEKLDSKVPVRIISKNGQKRWVTLSAKLTYKGDEPEKALVVACDINDFKEMENTLKKTQEGYRHLFTNIHEGFAYCRMVFDENGKPVDFVFLEVNPAFLDNVRLEKEAVIGKKVTDLFPGIQNNEPDLFEIFGRISLNKGTEHFEVFFKPLNRWISFTAYSPEPRYFALVISNISGSKKTK